MRKEETEWKVADEPVRTFEQDDPITSVGNNTGQSLVGFSAICSYAN